MDDKKADMEYIKPIQNIMFQTIERLEQWGSNQNIDNGDISTGFQSLDFYLDGGFQPSRLYVLAARPSMGTTAMAYSIINNIIINKEKKNTRIVYFNLDSIDISMVQRLLLTRCNIEFPKFANGALNQEDWNKIWMNLDIFHNSQLYIDDTSYQSVESIKERIIQFHTDKKIDFIVIDYFQLITAEENGTEKKESYISRQLKQLSRDLQVPILLLVRVNRNIERRNNKQPLIADLLKDTGSLVQNADVIMFLYRETYYNPDCYDKTTHISISKNNCGLVGVTNHFYLQRKYGKFIEILPSDIDKIEKQRK